MTESRSHLAHAWAVAIIGYWLVLAAALLIGPLIDWRPVLSLAGVPPWLSMSIGALLGVGSLLIFASLGRHRYRSTRWSLELAGLILSGGAWFGFGWVSTVAFPVSLSGWGQAAAFTVAIVLRGREVVVIEQRTREAADHLEDPGAPD